MSAGMTLSGSLYMTWRQVTFNNLSLGPVGSATQETLWYGGLHFWLPAHLCQWINQQGFDGAQKPLWGHGDSLLAGVLSAASYFLLVACFIYASLPYRPLGFKQKGPVCECFGRGVGGCEYGRRTCESAQGSSSSSSPTTSPSLCLLAVSWLSARMPSNLHRQRFKGQSIKTGSRM